MLVKIRRPQSERGPRVSSEGAQNIICARGHANMPHAAGLDQYLWKGDLGGVSAAVGDQWALASSLGIVSDLFATGKYT